MAKTTAEQVAIQALTQSLVDPTPKPLFGNAQMPGIFSGSGQALKNAAQLCLEQKWLEPAGDSDGSGRSPKEKYRLTAVGAQAAIERSEPVQLLRQALSVTQALANSSISIASVRAELLQQQQAILDALQKQQEATQHALQQQQTLIETALERWRMPFAANTNSAPAQGAASWRDEALQYLQRYQTQHIQAFCSLPDLFANVVSQHGASIGQFHDGIRTLVKAGEIRLHPFSGARYALEREEYALLADKEIMYYAERLLSS